MTAYLEYITYKLKIHSSSIPSRIEFQTLLISPLSGKPVGGDSWEGNMFMERPGDEEGDPTWNWLRKGEPTGDMSMLCVREEP